jgi:hypothetical protein
MLNVVRGSALSCLIGVAWTTTAGSVWACTCVSATPFYSDQHFAESRARAVLIFAGRVVDIQVRDDDVYLGERLPFKLKHAVATFLPIRSWKGQPQSTIQVHSYSGKDSALCDYQFELGKVYLVFAYGDPPIASLCDFTMDVQEEESTRTQKRLGNPMWVPH